MNSFGFGDSYYYPEYGSGFGFDSDFGSFPSEGMLRLLMTVYITVLAVMGIFAIVSYVMNSIGLYSIAKRRGIRKPGLAWVPVLSVWTLGSISDQYNYVKQGKVRSRRKLLLWLNVIVAVLYLIAVLLVVSMVFDFLDIAERVGNNLEMLDYMGIEDIRPILIKGIAFVGIVFAALVLAIIALVFTYICYYNLFVSCNPGTSVVFTVLGILFSVTLPFFVFATRKKDLGMPPKKRNQPVPPAFAPASPQPEAPAPAQPAAPEDSAEPADNTDFTL